MGGRPFVPGRTVGEYTVRAMVEPVLYVVAGLLVGVLIGFTGVGGGSLMTPILVIGFGQSPIVAVGTDLVFAATTKFVATVSFGHKRRVDWRIVRRLVLGSVPSATAVLGWFWLTPRAEPVVDHMVMRGLAVMLTLTAIGLVLQNRLQRLGSRLAAASLERAERYKPALTVATGVLLGAAVTLTSVGAGAVGVVALLYLYPLRLTPDRLIATDIAHALPVTIIAGLGHAALGHLNLPVLGCLLLGSIPGVLFAARTTIRFPPAVTRMLVAAMLIVVAARIVLS
jgi:uncharacterized protein